MYQKKSSTLFVISFIFNSNKFKKLNKYMKKIIIILLYAIAIPFSAYADNGIVTKIADPDSAINRLENLERNLNILQKYVYNNYNGQADNKSAAAIPNNINVDEIGEQFKGIRGELERLQYIINKINDKIINLEDKINQLEKNGSSINKNDIGVIDNIEGSLDEANVGDQNHNSDSSKLEKTASNKQNNKSNKTAEEDYQEAYNLLKESPNKGNDGEYHANVRKAFENFIKNNPKNSLVGNAYYWIAETYSHERDYEKAAIYYFKGYKANKNSGRAPDNLLKLGETLIKLGKIQEACTTLAKLGSEFPNASNMIKRGMKEAMDKANCE